MVKVEKRSTSELAYPKAFRDFIPQRWHRAIHYTSTIGRKREVRCHCPRNKLVHAMFHGLPRRKQRLEVALTNTFVRQLLVETITVSFMYNITTFGRTVQVTNESDMGNSS